MPRRFQLARRRMRHFSTLLYKTARRSDRKGLEGQDRLGGDRRGGCLSNFRVRARNVGFRQKVHLNDRRVKASKFTLVERGAVSNADLPERSVEVDDFHFVDEQWPSHGGEVGRDASQVVECSFVSRDTEVVQLEVRQGGRKRLRSEIQVLFFRDRERQLLRLGNALTIKLGLGKCSPDR